MVGKKNTKPKDLCWDCFTKINDNKYKCRYCDAVYKHNATRLRLHITTQCKKAPDAVIKTTIQKKSNTKNADNGNANNSNSSFQSCASAHEVAIASGNSAFMSNYMDSITQKENEIVQKMLSKAVIVTGLSFRTFEHQLWRDFFKRLRPAFKLPSRLNIGGNHLEEHYQSTAAEIKNKLTNSSNLHLQCDGWTNIRNEPIINFLITTPKPVFVKSLATDVNRHTAEYIQKEIEAVLEEHGSEKFCTIITDNASNFQKALTNISSKQPHIIPLRCVAHTLNLLA